VVFPFILVKLQLEKPFGVSQLLLLLLLYFSFFSFFLFFSFLYADEKIMKKMVL